MKGRSHRLQSSDPPDDWIDGSWTVDCVCGVNFDDGEEMVNCDECGVWVHTRCSRYVKGDDKFACDKCKSKINRSDTEETEVAQLLAELPTKTVRMENSLAPIGAPRRPFKLWTDMPMEERVHIQGIPGGDPSLFGGLSSIFNRQLWKCTGYVPKQFNFQYREFPCWDENSTREEDSENPINKGAGVLFSLSKESKSVTPIATLVDMRAREGEDGSDLKKSLKEMKKCDSEDAEAIRRAQSGMKKERSLLRSVVHSGKQKKEELGTSKDRSGKKRIKTSDKEVDPKGRTSHSSKTDRGLKNFKTDDTWSLKNKTLKDIFVQEHVSNNYSVVDTIMEEPNINSATTEDSSEALYPDTTRRSFSVVPEIAEEKNENKAPSVSEFSSKTDDNISPYLKNNSDGNASIKEQEGDGLVVNNADDSTVVRRTVSPAEEELCGPAPEHKDNQDSQDFDYETCPGSGQSNPNVKREGVTDNFGKHLISHSSSMGDLKSDEKLPKHKSDHVNDSVVTNSSYENKVDDSDRKSEVIIDCHTNNPEELSCHFCSVKQEMVGSEGPVETHKGISEIEGGSGYAEDAPKSETTLCPHTMSSCLGKSSSSSSTMNSKIPASDKKSDQSEIPNPLVKHGVMEDCNMHSKKESNQNDIVRDEVPRKSQKERSKSSSNSNLKAMHSSKSAQNAILRQVSADSKDFVNSSSSKASGVHPAGTNLGLNESDESSLHQKSLQAPNKISSSVPQRGEKINQTNSQPSSKVNQNHVPSPSPTSNSSAMLSDEELALLLHQELNSSPRVPRVPRARHGGSLPQLTSPSGASMLSKRTSSAGGKDYCLFSRRKYKDASRDGLCGSRELEDEAKRIENASSSFDQKKKDMECGEGASVMEEGHISMTTINSTTKNVAPASAATANSSSASPPEDQNLSFIRNSPKNISDDDNGTAGRPAHRTLPGLINEIMSKGRRISYEELCNAVLPHWNNLRKHNGDRYAYTSHSQAVLDCLRNRHEWARLVDRGPKTNSTRKRRKFDEESDDNVTGKGRASKGGEGKNFELQKEEFPKGKRKARKRRRLALQGIAVKTRRRKVDSLTDEDVGPFSNSSEESEFSEDEIQGGRTGQVGSEASSSSDEEGSA
ncbi:uncharacterized protein LOC114715327 isoform X2 [Neltuma alba]|uniref:uncharacterized protein LOC114715327 isoform X2 n=1 Tax=Neltuma alba TaxID=207710 RepID=UPI0010A56C1A|nr:uncharacterized protein LOC114715327 isoform X2 [Prosopis alba]